MTPGKLKAPEGTGADAITRHHQAESIDQDPDEDDGPGFWDRAMSGKVRPAPREPGVTHYGCDCCRWSA